MNIYLPGSTDGVVNGQGKRKILRKAVIAAAVASLFFAPGIHETEAAFTTNFTGVGVTGGTYDKKNSGGSGNYLVDFSCNMSYTVVSGINNSECGGSGSSRDISNNHDDATPFFQGLFTDTATSQKYFHVIIGDKLKAGQARNEMTFEYIIEATTSGTYTFDSSGPVSASYTDNTSISTATYAQINPYDGTLLKQSNGSGNPTRVIMDQTLFNADATVNTEFLKGLQGGTVSFNQTTGNMSITGGTIVFNSKPIITQFANSSGMYNQYTIDMRHKSYSDGTQMSDAEANGPQGKITNITNLIAGSGPGAGTPAADQGDYDTTNATMTAHYTNNSNPNYTAGAYTYTAGTGSFKALGGGGTYNYDIAATAFVETGFTPQGKDFTSFCEPTINPDWLTNSSNIIGGPKACMNAGSTRKGEGSKGWD
ncbi:MAG: hypothetical protein HY272_13505 [Gammaproteobacteria bacterium]|nr:hypothetical protein [Gammaproteobacteria bacterium]